MINELSRLLDDAWRYRRNGEYDAARECVDKALNLVADDDYEALGRIHHIYAQFEADADNHQGALEGYLSSHAYYHKTENPDKIAHSLRHIADTHRRLDNLTDSESSYRAAIAIYRDSSRTTKGDLANALRGFALVLERIEKTEEAIAVWEETAELYAACGLDQGVEEARNRIRDLS